MNKRCLWISLLVLVVSGFLYAKRGESQEFKVGACEVDITPTEAVPMWGYGDRHASLSEGTLDPLKA
ncbi:MAG: hypothetical protein ACKOOI_21750, partial [Pirellula sp.]